MAALGLQWLGLKGVENRLQKRMLGSLGRRK